MSLDVYLTMESGFYVESWEQIYIRENGEVRKLSREEWDARIRVSR